VILIPIHTFQIKLNQALCHSFYGSAIEKPNFDFRVANSLAPFPVEFLERQAIRIGAELKPLRLRGFLKRQPYHPIKGKTVGFIVRLLVRNECIFG